MKIYSNLITSVLVILSFQNAMAQSSIESCFSSEEKFPIQKNALMTDESVYMNILDKFEKKFSPLVLEKYSKALKIDYQVREDRVNASMTRDDDNNPVMIVTSGLLMYPHMSPNAFVAILCHELGHFLGGMPKKLRGNTSRKSWSSAEGQADYFAATKCLPIYYSGSKNVSKLNETLEKDQIDELYHICSSPLCMQIVLAGLEMNTVFARIKKFSSFPSLKQRDSTHARRTIYKHPALQCRLDTIVSGALCDVSQDESFSDLDPKVGACVGDIKGSRPRCWYNPSNPSL